MNKKGQNFLKTSNKLKIAIISLVVMGGAGGGIVFAWVQPYSSFAGIKPNVTIQADKLHGNLLGLRGEIRDNTTSLSLMRRTSSASPGTTSGTNILRSSGNVGIGRLNARAQLNVEGAIRTTRLIIQNPMPTIFFQDTNNRSGMIHMNSSGMHFMRGSGNNSTRASALNRQGPLALNMNNNDANFGGNININVRGKGIRFTNGTTQTTAYIPTTKTRIQWFIYQTYPPRGSVTLNCPTNSRPSTAYADSGHSTQRGTNVIQMTNHGVRCTDGRNRFGREVACVLICIGPATPLEKNLNEMNRQIYELRKGK